MNHVLLRDGDEALMVSWCELATTTQDGKEVYRNARATADAITDASGRLIATAGRARWRIEDENNDTRKAKGYNREHNFG